MLRMPLALTLAVALAAPALAQPLTTTFTYQGELATGGTPVSGLHDLRFLLFDDVNAGSQVGGTLCSDNLNLVNGRFTVSLDFGSVFSGQQRYLEIWARQDAGLACNNSTGFTILGPRQPLSATPNAAFALNTASLNDQPAAFYTDASNLSTGTLPDTRLSSNIPRLNAANTFTAANQFNAFTGVNRSSQVTSAEVFGLQNAPGQLGYTGMYIQSSDNAGGLPFYGYAVNNHYAWTFLDPTGVWRLFNAGEALAVHPSGDVSIGVTQPGAGRLTVAGNVNATEFNYATPQTSFLMVPPSLFTPANNSSAYFRGGANISMDTGTSAALQAPVQLPDGATIRTIQFFVSDFSPTVNVAVNMTTWVPFGTPSLVAGTTSTGINGQQTLTLSNINLVVNNGSSFLSLFAAVSGGLWPGSDMAIYGARIEYTLPRPAR